MGREKLLLGQFEDCSMELLEGRDMIQEIETQKAIDSTLGWQVVASDRHRSNPLSKGNDLGDGNDRKVFQTARSDDRDLARRFRRIASDGDCSFYRDDRDDCPGVNGQAENLASSGSFQESVRYQDPCLRKAGGFSHGLKGQGVTSRKTVVRVGNQSQLFVLHHRPVDFVPVFAVGQKSSPPEYGDGWVHIFDLDQQPLPVKPLSDLSNRLAFHGRGDYTTSRWGVSDMDGERENKGTLLETSLFLTKGRWLTR